MCGAPGAVEALPMTQIRPVRPAPRPGGSSVRHGRTAVRLRLQLLMTRLAFPAAT